MVAFALIGAFAVLLVLGAPIAICLGASSVLALRVQGLVLDVTATTIYTSIAKFVLLAVPFFVLSGNIMEKAGISDRLIRFAQSFVGHIRGGLCIVLVLVSCFFAAISGSGPATVAALGLIAIPAMIKVGYQPAFAAALMAISGAIGVIIPPSVPFVVYGSISGASIGDLFLAGIFPGCLMGLVLILVALWVSRKADLAMLPKASPRECWSAFKDAVWGLMMPVIILGGIYGGVFTPTEAAVVSVVYGLLVGIVVYRTIKLGELVQICINTASQTSVVIFIMATASIFALVLTISGISASVRTGLVNISEGSPFVFLLIVNVILLIAGCFIDTVSAFYIFTPVLYPIAANFGIHPVHLGVIMTMNLAIGLTTPPVGVNLYTAAPLAKTNLHEISRHVVPLIVGSIVVLMLVTYIPSISMVLVRR